VGGGAAYATGKSAGTGRTQTCRSSAADCADLGSADNRQVFPLPAFTRAAAPPFAGDAGRVGAGRRPSATDSDCDRRFALGRPFETGAAATAGRERSDGAAAASLHSAPRVSRPMAVAHASYANHSQPAERAQRAHYDGRSV